MSIAEKYAKIILVRFGYRDPGMCEHYAWTENQIQDAIDAALALWEVSKSNEELILQYESCCSYWAPVWIWVLGLERYWNWRRKSTKKRLKRYKERLEGKKAAH